jgi:hypothetical protein
MYAMQTVSTDDANLNFQPGEIAVKSRSAAVCA